MSTRSRTAGALVIALLVLVAAAGCSSDSDADAVPADAQQLTLTMGDALSFDQPALTVQAGKPVLLTIKSTGKTDHDFMITGMPASNIKNEIKGGDGHNSHSTAGAVAGHPKMGEAVTIRFTPTQPGTYEFYCSITGHKDAGMKGVLTVT